MKTINNFLECLVNAEPDNWEEALKRPSEFRFSERAPIFSDLHEKIKVIIETSMFIKL